MVASDKGSRAGAEASLKYVLFGATTSAIMIYGVSLLYGRFRTLDLSTIARQISGEGSAMTVITWFGLFATVVGHTSRIFVVALQIAAPTLAVSFIVTLVFSVLSRAVPQMNVFILSFSFRIAGGLAVFGFTLHLTAQHVINYLNRLPDDLLNLAQLMGG